MIGKLKKCEGRPVAKKEGVREAQVPQKIYGYRRQPLQFGHSPFEVIDVRGTTAPFYVRPGDLRGKLRRRTTSRELGCDGDTHKQIQSAGGADGGCEEAREEIWGRRKDIGGAQKGVDILCQMPGVQVQVLWTLHRCGREAPAIFPNLGVWPPQ